MFGLGKPKLPIAEEVRLWIDDCFLRLAGLLGANRIHEAVVMLPTPEYFPDEYDGSMIALQVMFRRVAERMQVDASAVDLEFFADEATVTRGLVPFGEGRTSAPGGLYVHAPETKAQIAIHEKQMKDPLSLVATLAHELGHVILLRPGLVDRSAKDMEPMTDLLTVFLGFGVFNANSAFQFRQFTDLNSQGWSTSRLGYLSEEMFGYALARFALERGEEKPEWTKFLTKNIAHHFKQSAAWLKENSGPILVGHS